MQKKLTITLDEKVYEGLHSIVGRGNISQFIEALVQPHVINKDLEDAYRQMAQDEEREVEALEWSEALIGDGDYETRRGLVGEFRSVGRRGNKKETSGRNHKQ